MRTFDFSPLWRSTIGFDHLADLLDSNLQQSADDNYPPYNLERCGEDAYRISLAVAGFGVDDITVTAERDTLVIEGKKPDAEQREYRRRDQPDGLNRQPARNTVADCDHRDIRQHHPKRRADYHRVELPEPRSEPDCGDLRLVADLGQKKRDERCGKGAEPADPLGAALVFVRE